MNYKDIYLKTVSKFKNQILEDGVYFEKHHIVPRYAGGSDDEDNLVKVTYKQHIFLHKVLFALYRNPQDLAAVRLMSSIKEDKKFILCSMAGKIGGAKNRDSGWIRQLGMEYGYLNGKANVESGQLDRIRHLANNEVQLAKVSALGRSNVETGRIYEALELAWEANRGREWTESQKEVARNNQLERIKEDPEYLDKLRSQQKQAIAKKEQLGQERSDKIINSEILVEEFLHKTSTRSKNIFVSPTGLKFESPIYAATYYSAREDAYIIESWCKNFKFGWSIIPKPAKS